MRVNHVLLAGHLTRDPELKYSQNNLPVVNFTLAVNESVKRGEGYQDEVSFIGVVAFGSAGEACAKFLAKGSHCLVEGKLRQDRWEDKSGKQQSKTKIIAEKVHFLNLKKKETTDD